ncbi:LacI family DNA-binding transcriptional regulator [Oceaniglobus roseus]|uniref:LacI family DNA-binding transcriptional regulator n=1 Tax=Oceaniglobus roseus TaxID=1737570 RepID=UPI0015623740|nr:LacI family DNA-binding transcriptional regulator [Kandeliimicrobium roseum]
MSRRANLRDIADAVGVSVSAVSLALRGEARVSEETAERIRAAAKRLGYVPNRAASALRTQRSDIVAVCLNDLSNPIFNEFLTHIEDELQQSGRMPYLGVSREDPERQARFLEAAISQGAGGLLICPARGTTPEDLRVVLPTTGRAPFPTVLFSRSLEDVACPQFGNDDFAAGQLMAERLLAGAHETYHWLGGGHDSSTARAREAGFRNVMERAGHVPGIHHGPTSRAFGHATAARLLRESSGPVGFACFSDLIAFGVLAAAAQAGLRAGRDLSVIGCDDMEEARFSVPPLTSIWIDKSAIGRLAARSVLDPEAEAVTRRIAPRLADRATVRSPSATPSAG